MGANTKEIIRSEFEEVRSEFHDLAASITKEDLDRKSKNPGWTNGEILFHMLLGFIVIDMLFPMVKIFGRLPTSCSRAFAGVLNFSTPIFNASNAFGARVGGRVFSKRSLEKKFDTVISKLLKKLDGVKMNEWEQGMYYPDRWDGLFDEYMTVEKLFYYPIKHFKFHLKQLTR
ncbi:MAG: DinB family protein [Candidatus Levybacteria bacterium]|nr:DinB family protein [Candidatus Levybacteria bacterium]